MGDGLLSLLLSSPGSLQVSARLSGKREVLFVDQHLQTGTFGFLKPFQQEGALSSSARLISEEKRCSTEERDRKNCPSIPIPIPCSRDWRVEPV